MILTSDIKETYQYQTGSIGYTIGYSFDLSNKDWDGTFTVGGVTNYSFDDLTSKTLDDQTYFEGILDNWARYTVLGFAENNTSPELVIYEADTNENVPTPTQTTANTLGATYPTDLSTGFYTHAEIVIDKDDVDITNSQGYWVALHEIGHALGLKGDGSLASYYTTDITVMSYNVPNGRYAISPMALDILALEEMYGAASHNTGDDDTYSFVTSGGSVEDFNGTNRSQTIMDTGGISDTFDFSAYTSGGVIVDLRQAIDSSGNWTGYFSKVGDEHIYIAHNTVIEKAIGGTGDDVFRGIEGNVQTFDGRSEINGDTVDYGHYIGAIDINLAMGTDSEGNTLISIENAILSDAGGSVIGGNGDETLNGGSGDDTLNGGSGSDTLYGGSGNDTLTFQADGVTQNYSYADAGDDIDYFRAQYESTDLILGDGFITTESGIVDNVEGLIGIADNVQVQSLGWNIDLDQERNSSFMDYSTIDQSLDFLFNDTSWSVSETDSNPLSDIYTNFKTRGNGIIDTDWYMTGTNFGDTFTINDDSGAGNMTLGTGDDNVYIYETNDNYRVWYTGGLDVVHQGEEAFLAGFLGDIDLSDISIQQTIHSLTGSGGTRNIDHDITYSVSGKGSLTLKNVVGSVNLGADGVFGTSDDNYFSAAPTFLYLNQSRLSMNGALDLSYYSQIDQKYGTQLGDQYVGSSANNRFEGLAGNDNLSGNSGNDTLYGQAGDDTLYGGDDNDFLYGGFGDDFLVGGNGVDNLYGSEGADSIEGGLGNDSLFGGSEDDFLSGGEGNDTLNGGAGEDRASFSGLFSNYSISVNGSVTTVLDNVNNDGSDKVSNVEIFEFFDGIYENSIFINDSIDGTPSVDVLNGNYRDNFISGLEDDDTLNGNLGNDTLNGGLGNDTLDGGDGIDTASYANDTARVYVDLASGNGYQDWDGSTSTYTDTLTSIENAIGGSADDKLLGNTAANTLQGNAGRDYLNGGDGADILDGGADEDLVVGGDGNDIIHGGDGNDKSIWSGGVKIFDGGLQGGDGNDTIFGDDGDDQAWGQEGNDTLDGGTGNDVLEGDEGDDIINGGDGDDTIFGDDQASTTGFTGAGNDILNGGAGNDVLAGGDGDDELHGGADNDQLWGTAGSDTIYGDAGDDVIYGDFNGVSTVNDAADTIYGGDGNDVINAGGGDDIVSGGNDNDTIYARDGNDTVNGDAGNDSIYGENGNDTINGGIGGDYLIGGAGDDIISGDADNDTLAGDAGEDTLSGGTGNDQLWGGDDNDTLSGGAGIDALYGQEGNDVLNGGDDRDYLYGDANTLDESTYSYSGDDVLNGEGGNDYLYGGRGNDTMNGGAGIDVFYGGSGNDTINGGSENDYLYGDAGTLDESTYSYSGDDVMDGGTGNDQLYGGRGADTMTGGAGIDVLYGGSGNDIINGGDDNDYLYGDSGLTFTSDTGDDVLNGEAGNDQLYGQLGNDTLLFGEGADLLYGGAGDDVFKVYEVASQNSDMGFAMDFVEGEDAIDISSLLSGYDPMNDAITDFVNIAQGSHTTIQVDRDGTGTAFGWDNVLRIQGNNTLDTDEATLIGDGTLII